MAIRLYHFGDKKTTVTVEKFNVLPTSNILDTLTSKQVNKSEKKIFVFDEKTWELFGGPSVFKEENSLVLPRGEKAKNFESLQKVLSFALEKGLTRGDRIVGIGGGVVCDITGLAASLYMRGTGLSLIPTTLLAMADASIGGKTGIDYLGYKNTVGTFYPADAIHLFPGALSTLPEREIRNGMAEVIKHGFLGDLGLLEKVKSEGEKLFKEKLELPGEFLLRAVEVKTRIVEQDLREGGIRAHLNFGHTFAHALETVTRFNSWSHGEAVAWGMAMAFRLGMRIGITPRDYGKWGIGILEELGYTLTAKVEGEELLAAMERDKKKEGKELRFVLQRGGENTVVLDVKREEIRKVLKET